MTSDRRSWLQAVTHFATDHQVAPELVDALQAYGRGGERTWDGDFAQLEASLQRDTRELERRIRVELAQEVDAHQAGMFADRFRSVADLLGADASAEARILGVGLLERIRQVLDEAGPTRALRVRGVVDYIYSRAALLWHTRREGPAPSLSAWVAAWVSSPGFREIRPGIRFGRLEGPTEWGPQHVSVLQIDPGAAQLDAIDAWQAWGPHQDLPALVRAEGAVAAFSGGFFLYSEPDLTDACQRHDPVGLVVRQGQVVRPAVLNRAALVQHHDGTIDIRVIGCGDHELDVGAGWQRPTAWRNRAHAARASGTAIVGDRVVGAGTDLEVPLNGVVISALDHRPAGVPASDRVRWRLPGIRTAMAGGPGLLVEGRPGLDLVAEDFAGTAPPRTFVDDETGDRNLLPRLAVGLDQRGRLLVVAVDGRHAERALGLGLHSLGELLAGLGAVRAMNLDGGSSKRMVVDGTIVDLPSIGVQGAGLQVTEVRPLHTAVLVRPAP